MLNFSRQPKLSPANSCCPGMHELVAQWSIPLPRTLGNTVEPIVCHGAGVFVLVFGARIFVLRDGSVMAERNLHESEIDGFVAHATIIVPRTGPVIALTSSPGYVERPRSPSRSRCCTLASHWHLSPRTQRTRLYCTQTHHHVRFGDA